MPLTSIGDLASSLMLRSRSNQIKQTIATLSEELATGRTHDVHARVGGNYSYIADLEAGILRMEAYAISATETGLRATGMQASLSRANDIATSLSSTFIAASPITGSQTGVHGPAIAQGNLEELFNGFNSSVAGSYIFSGTETKSASLASSDQLLDELRTVLTGLTDVGDIFTAAENWFNDPAGFDATIYTGGQNTSTPIQIGDAEQVNLTLRADSPEIKAVIQEVAIAALVDDPSIGLDQASQAELLRLSGERLLSVSNDLTGVQADLGYTEARIEDSLARTSSSRTSLEYAKGSLIAADPYETAVRLEEAQFQLESLYAVTVRNSSLSLVNFLR